MGVGIIGIESHCLPIGSNLIGHASEPAIHRPQIVARRGIPRIDEHRLFQLDSRPIEVSHRVEQGPVVGAYLDILGVSLQGVPEILLGSLRIAPLLEDRVGDEDVGHAKVRLEPCCQLSVELVGIGDLDRDDSF